MTIKPKFLKHDYEATAESLKGELPDPSNIREILEDDTQLISPDGTIVAVFRRKVVPERIQEPAYKVLKMVDELPANRVSAVGTIPLSRGRRNDGTWSGRKGVNDRVVDVLEKRGVRTGILGYLPCHSTRLTKRHLEMLVDSEPLIKIVDSFYAECLPDFYQTQLAVVKNVSQYRLANTVFPTLYVSKNWQTCYHRDGNLKGAMTAITPLGKFVGGALVLLRWAIAIPYQPGDILFFDAQQLHGNLPFSGRRISVAFYCPRRIANCSKPRASERKL